MSSTAMLLLGAPVSWPLQNSDNAMSGAVAIFLVDGMVVQHCK
jgi:hypothetical protein